LIPRETLGLAAEFAVASELCRRGFYAQLTLGNKKRTDLLIYDDDTDSFLRIEVKAKQGRDWPNCKGIYGKDVILIFVDYLNKQAHERPDFFVLTVEDWREVVTAVIAVYAGRYPDAFINERNVAVWPSQLTNGKPYEGAGIKVAMIEQHREAWGKIRDGRREAGLHRVSAVERPA
jgi:hypothetical protein